MGRMKKRAREIGTGMFEAVPVPPAAKRRPSRPREAKALAAEAAAAAVCPAVPVEVANVSPVEVAPAAVDAEVGAKRKKGRPRKEKSVEIRRMELSVTVSVGGGDVDPALIDPIQDFLKKETLAGKCCLERGGTLFHLHFQMVIRIMSHSMAAVSKLLKKYLGWDTAKPPGGVVMCRSVKNKGVHTFHGLLGYCMKDDGLPHFVTVDHNIAADDMVYGLDQYAIHGAEENKTKVALTSRNILERCLMWYKFNWKHPLVSEFDEVLFKMLQTGKYYPSASWVVSGSGKGYNKARMQSLWNIVVSPATITRMDVERVFHEQERDEKSFQPRMDWFTERRKQCNVPPEPRPAIPEVHADVFAAADRARTEFQTNYQADNGFLYVPMVPLAHSGSAAAPILAGSPLSVWTSEGTDSTPLVRRGRVAAGNVPMTDAEFARAERVRRRKNASPMRDLWPEEWHVYSNVVTESCSTARVGPDHPVSPTSSASRSMFGNFIQLFKRQRLDLHIS